MVRFGLEAILARRFGTSLLRIFESDAAQQVALGLVVIAIVGTAIAIARAWQSSRATAAA
jgi:hypothetical protein